MDAGDAGAVDVGAVGVAALLHAHSAVVSRTIALERNSMDPRYAIASGRSSKAVELSASSAENYSTR
jgi:hypothetical protein